MSKENVVSIEIPKKELQEVQVKVKEVKALLQSYLIALKPVQRRELAKMSDKTIPFVEKVIEYVQSNPEFIPPYMQTEELFVDFKAHGDLMQIYREIEQICKNLDDTMMMSGSEAYVSSLAYYNSVKQAAKMNIPNAKSIYEDLRQRFEKKTEKKP